MQKGIKLAHAFMAKNAGRIIAASVVLGSASAYALDPLGVIATFDVSTAAVDIKTVMLLVLTAIAAIYGCCLGFVFLRFGYRKIVGALVGGAK
jgi:hypothetical protein